MDWSIPVGLIGVESNENKEEIDLKLREQGFTFLQKYMRDSYYFNFNYFRKNYFNI